jgi:hypothetical protein
MSWIRLGHNMVGRRDFVMTKLNLRGFKGKEFP